MPALLHTLETSGLGALVRESLYGFPILVSIHLMGLALSIGCLVWFDLRLIGLVLPAVPVSRVYKQLMPWAAGGFVVVFASGAMLFTGYAGAAYNNPYFRIKMTAILLAALNAAFYHRVTERTGSTWDRMPTPPPSARAAGLISMLLWAIVIVCGRLMSYTMY